MVRYLSLSIVAVSLLCLSSGCAIWGYSTKPEGAMDLEPVQASVDERLHYWVQNVSGITFGGREGMVQELEECTVFADKRPLKDPPAKGLHVLARATYREPSVGALASGYMSLSIGLLVPVYSGSGGFDVYFTVTRDGTEVSTYQYKIYREALVWLPLIPFFWVAALTDDEDQAFAGLTRQFFHDAIRDGVFEKPQATTPEVESPKQPLRVSSAE